MNHAIEVHLAANIDKYKAGMDAAKKMGSDSMGFIASIFDKIKSMFSGLWDSFKSFFSGGTDKFKSMFGSMSSSAGGAFSKISGYFSGFNSDMDKSQAKMGETEEKSSSLTSKIITGLVVAFAALAAVTGVLVAKGLAVDSMFASVGMSSDIAVSQISRFSTEAARSGVDVQSLGTSMAKFREEMKKSAAGDGTSAFDKLGVKVADSNNALLQTDDVLIDVSKKIAGMSTEAEKYAMAAKLGFEGKAQVLEDIAHATDLSTRVTDEQAGAVVRLGKIWREILPSGQSMWSTISDKLTNSLTPAMVNASSTILESKNRIIDAFSQIYGGGSVLDKLGTKIQEWSQKASTWFAGVAKSSGDMTISIMKFVASKTGLGNADAFSPKAGYVPGAVTLNGTDNAPVITDAEKELRKQFDATNKSLGDRIELMRRQVQVGDTLTEGQRAQLQLDNSKLKLTSTEHAASQKQIDTLIALETQFKNIQDAKARDAAATKKEEEAYATLISSIQSKIDVNQLELKIGDASTESQKLQAKLDAELASGKLKLSAAHLATARAKLVELGVSEQQLKVAQSQREVDKYIAESVLVRNQQNAALAVEYEMYGKSADARAIAMVAIDAETWKEKELDKLRADKLPVTDEIIQKLTAEAKARTEVGQATMGQTQALQYATQLADENKKFGLDYIVDDKQRAAAQLALDSQVWRERIQNAGDGTQAQQRLQEQFDDWYKNQSIKPALDEQKQMWSSFESTAHDTFVSIFDSGKSAFNRLRDALKNGLLDLLYQLTLKKWIVQVQAQTSASLTDLAANPGDPGAAASSLASSSSNPLISAVGMASTAYKAISTGIAGLGTSLVSSLGAGITTLGNAFGSSALSTFGQGMQGFGLDGSIGGASGAGLATGSSLASGATMLGGAAVGMIGGKLISGQYGSSNTVTAGTAIGAAVGSIVPILGTALGAALGGVLGGVANRLFGMGNTEVKSQGVSGTYDGSTVTGDTYQKLHQDGGLFRSDKDWSTSQALTTEMQSQLTQAFTAIKISAGAAAATLGLGASALDSYSKTFDITLTGDATKDQQAVTDFFAGVSDDVANMLVPSLASFSQSGETATATLTRLVSEFTATTAAAQNLGKTAAEMFGSDDMSSAGARDKLVQAAGGTDALTSLTSAFSQSFLTDAERLAPVSKALDAALSGLDLTTIPTTIEQYKALVQSINPVDEASDKLLVSLLQLAPAFAQVHPDTTADDAQKAAAVLDERKGLMDQLDELTMSSTQLLAKQRDALDESNVALFDQIQGIKAQAAALQAMKDAASTLVSDADNDFSVLEKVTKVTTDALTARINAEKALSDAVKSTLSSMKTSTTDLADRAEAQAQIRAAVASVQAGGALPDADSLKDAFSVVSKDSESQFATKADYLKDLYSTQNDLSALGDLADSSLSVDQKQLDSLNDMLATQQQMLDKLKGIDTTGLTIAQALAAFQGAIIAAMANPVNAATSAISGAYQTSLGRAPDAAGLAYWQQAAASGTSVADIVKSISTSSEAQVQQAYQSLLGRTADSAGLNYWLGTGQSVDAIKADIMQSDEYKKLHGVPGFADGGDFGGGLRLVGENGPELEVTGPSRIFNSGQTSDLMRSLSSPSSNADALASAVDRLNATVERQNGIIDGQGKTIELVRRECKRQADFIERLTNGGKYMPTKEVESGIS